MVHEHIGIQIENEQLADPVALQSRDGIRATEERDEHDSEDHCSVGTDGRVAVDVRNDDGEHLLLIHDEHGVALLPNETVAPDEDWAAVAREAAESYTGIEIELDTVLAVRTVDHVLSGEDEPHLTTHRVVVRGSPAGGEIDECKRAAENGSDEWRVEWLTDLPGDISTPEGGPRDDLELVLD